VASIVERTSRGERRFYVKFRAFDREQGRERVIWEPQPLGVGVKEARKRRDKIATLLHEHGGRWPFPDEKANGDNLTVKAWLERWLDERAPQDASERVVDLYRHNLRTHVEPEIGTQTLDELKRRDLNELVQTLYGKKLSKNTIRNVLSPLTKALNAALDDELIDANPAARLKVPEKASQREPMPPTPAELTKILGKASQDGQDVIRTIAGLGLRPGEALGLRWCDVDAKRGLVHVRRQAIRGQIEERTKTKAGTRKVSLFPSVRAALEARAWRQGLVLDLLHDDERLIFPSVIGTPLDLTNFRRREWDSAVKAAGLSGLILRDLRHYAASALRDQGMDNKLRSTMIGHADEKITDTIYTHVNEAQVAKASEQFDPLVSVG
jgi:integrase